MAHQSGRMETCILPGNCFRKLAAIFMQFFPVSALLIGLAAAVCPALLLAANAPEKTVRVRTSDELRAAARTAGPGTRIELTPGEYSGDVFLENLRGEKGRPVVIAGADPKKPPHFVGGGNGLHLNNPSFVELRDLQFSKSTANGVSIDDGGKFSPAARGIVLHGLRITDVGPRGNHDGIKLSGVYGFRVENCVVERWGTGSGSGIDMVGCHGGLITGCQFRHVANAEATGGAAVQAKGGSGGIIIRDNLFEHAGQRSLNIGGSTGLEYFRPPLSQWPKDQPRSEASDITVEGNVFIGSLSPLCFVGVDGATVRFNTIYRPGKWALRILQETKDPGFVLCRNGVIEDNVIVFHSASWFEGGSTSARTPPRKPFALRATTGFAWIVPTAARPNFPRRKKGAFTGWTRFSRTRKNWTFA